MPRKTNINRDSVFDQCPLTSRCKRISNIDCTNRNYPDCGYFQNEILEYCKQRQTKQDKAPCKYRTVCRRHCWEKIHKTTQATTP